MCDMKRILILLLTVLLAIVLLTTCGESAQEASSPVKPEPSLVKLGNPSGDKWSVFIYLCGTDLETQSGSQNGEITIETDN